MEALFDELAARLPAQVADGETATIWFSAERSDFVRFNHGKVRQAGHVDQVSGRLQLIRGRRHASLALTLSGRAGEDRQRLARAFDELRPLIGTLPEDPHLLVSTEVQSTRTRHSGRLPGPEAAVDAVVDGAQGLDLVGFLASGPVCRGFANSLGQRNFHQVETFNLEWSLYHRADKAIKSSYAGFDWSAHDLAARMARSREQFAVLARPPRTVAPGRYRAYLAPAAISEITGMLGWGGFSGRAQRLGQSCLLRLASGEATLSPALSVTENIAGGVAPPFQGDGFVRPGETPLIVRGRAASALVSPRTAREFDIAHNGAGAQESPEALDIAAGDLPLAQALSRLGTGIYVGNLWYLNFSDRPACRMTGLTRFGTFWVEGGEIVAPLEVMRFDDSLYRVLGDRLEALTCERELLLEPTTYRERTLASAHLPGALVSELTLTL